jgi:Ca2+-binding EF-hand superfamily protein
MCKFMIKVASSSLAVHAQKKRSGQPPEAADMLLPALILLASAGQAPAPASPITVTGHPWAPFISPMGEPFRARSASDDTLARWFYQADGNHDGQLTADEMRADAERFFATLDTNHDGEIDPDELANYEYEVAPDIQVMSRTKRARGQAAAPPRDDSEIERPRDRRRRHDEEYASLGMGGALQGAARYALLNIPEPVAAADTDFNRGISLDEFRQAAIARFQLLDRARQGRLTLAQLEALLPAVAVKGHGPKLKDKTPDARVGNPLPAGN